MSFAPRFSPDGQRVIMSLQEGCNADIYIMDSALEATTRLTDTPAIDTSPSYSPDGSQICFKSDRGGQPQIYVMRRPAARRTASASAPAATPRRSGAARRLIAFTKQSAPTFAIGVMKPDGSGERILTEGFHNEGPTLAPNGRVIMYFSDVVGSPGRRCSRSIRRGAISNGFRHLALPPIPPGRRSCREPRRAITRLPY